MLKLRDISNHDDPRIDMHDEELNRVLGGGLVPGSIVLLGGEPGIGKSTLSLQTMLRMPEKKILYVSGEESAHQLKMRANRIPHEENDKFLILCENSLENIFDHIKDEAPELVIIDSIQTIMTEDVESSAGSIAQVRECASSLLRFAKTSGVPVILIGHITKEGTLAGPKILEHIVDTVIQFEGDQHYMYRILRSMKNRFGSTAELGIYEMQQNGLRQVSNPSELLLSQDHDGLSGIAISSAIEGVRPFLVETQALVSTLPMVRHNALLQDLTSDDLICCSLYSRNVSVSSSCKKTSLSILPVGCALPIWPWISLLLLPFSRRMSIPLLNRAGACVVRLVCQAKSDQ